MISWVALASIIIVFASYILCYKQDLKYFFSRLVGYISVCLSGIILDPDFNSNNKIYITTRNKSLESYGNITFLT